MSYRVRKQAITGKLVLQRSGDLGWQDATHAIAEVFDLVPYGELQDLRHRVAQADKRAAAQRARRSKATEPQQ